MHWYVRALAKSIKQIGFTFRYQILTSDMPSTIETIQSYFGKSFLFLTTLNSRQMSVNNFLNETVSQNKCIKPTSDETFLTYSTISIPIGFYQEFLSNDTTGNSHDTSAPLPVLLGTTLYCIRKNEQNCHNFLNTSKEIRKQT